MTQYAIEIYYQQDLGITERLPALAVMAHSAQPSTKTQQHSRKVWKCGTNQRLGKTISRVTPTFTTSDSKKMSSRG
ncbi:hypothetical protein OCU04_000693 [Sclerotinia nivalis]|uniref:Uncharacterized protein n=1 Tax=Sclerotinia nivalis TaxID=352851 RepID=A0A9X0AXP0_9HELO|nr:hypothetical protein OCU04_000693 [Sclerotinia nivalis]